MRFDNSKSDLQHAVESLEAKLRESEQRSNASRDRVQLELKVAIDHQRIELVHVKWYLGFVATMIFSLVIRAFFLPSK